MSRNRIPTAHDLASLSRDAWEELAHDLCAVIYDTERVEDRLGRGNGLDALRQLMPNGVVEGWQFKRFDDRLEDKQVGKLKDAVTRAVAACTASLGGPLGTFTVFGNIDLQPAHGTAKGEDARFAEFRVWCKNTHGVDAIYRGVTWVRARLLKNPYLRPDLFEDLPAAIASAKEEILAAIDGQSAIRRELDEVKARSEGQLSILAAEAINHLERGREHGHNEEFVLAVRSLRDAERLAKAPGVPADLLARIQAVLAGALYVSGYLSEAVAVGREAVLGATNQGDSALLRLAMGNLALALSDAQVYQESRQLFLRVLQMDEDAADLGEVVRTLANLLSVDIRLKEWRSAETLSRRLEPRIRELEARIGPSETSVNALGNIATFHLDSALQLRGPIQTRSFQLAAESFDSMANACRTANLQRTAAIADSNLAKALWFLDRYDDSDAAFDRAVKAAGNDLGKVAADCRYNQAIMLMEAGRQDGALRAAKDALRRYNMIGDAASALDAQRLLEKISGPMGGT